MGGVSAVSDKHLIRVSEIFGPTIEGEGTDRAADGVRAHGWMRFPLFWCDSMHAVDNDYRDTWKAMTPEAIMEEVARLSGGKPILITLSGATRRFSRWRS